MVTPRSDSPVPSPSPRPLRVLLVGDASAVSAATERGFRDAGGHVRRVDEPASAIEAKHLVESTAAALGGLDAVVRWTPVPAPRPLLGDPAGLDDDGFGADVDRMLMGAQRLSVAAARVMSLAGGGSIVLVGPIDASHAYPGRGAVAVAMAGIMGLARALGVELAGVRVRANVVLMGPMADDDGRPVRDGQQAARTLLRSPRPSLVTATEVAGAIRFVAGPSSAFMTGQSLRVDAGWASLNQAPDGMGFS
jgi:3-oxoacyl-[acyl-carrier protein] reductase